MKHKIVLPENISDNVFELISKRWMLVSAGDLSAWNTMTASWGGLGYLWNQNLAFVFVRPTRHTHSFIERAGRMSLSFFDETWREALSLCGRVSGRDIDKAAATGLKPFEIEPSLVSFEQSAMIITCTVLYKQNIDPACFTDTTLLSLYDNDYHRMYAARIDTVYRADKT